MKHAKPKKFRRYKGSVFYRSSRRWILPLLTVLLCAVLIVAGYFIARTVLEPGKEDPSSLPTIPTAPTTSPTGQPTKPPTDPTNPTTPTEPTARPTDPTNPTTPTEPTTPPTAPGSSIGEEIAALAHTLIGTEFKMGGNGPDVFDNNGLVNYCLRTCGAAHPSRKIADLLRDGAVVALDDLQPGDVVFFSNDIGGETNYIGIYVGNGKFVAANRPGKPTSEYNVRGSYWQARYKAARRFS